MDSMTRTEANLKRKLHGRQATGQATNRSLLRGEVVRDDRVEREKREPAWVYQTLSSVGDSSLA